VTIKVSVFCLCYNHEKFIEKALLSIVNQKTDFEFEVIVFDDLSPDSSRDIIDRVVEENHLKCHFVKLYPEENQYSKGITIGPVVLPQARGDFIAFCEGDDYWCDENKLQKQYDEIVKRPEVNACFHPVYTLIGEELVDKKYGYLGEENEIVSFKTIIKKGGGYMPMASLFIRTKPFLELTATNPDFFHYNCEHSVIQIINSVDKGALYIPGYMSVYRSMHEGSWSLQQAKDPIAEDREFEQYKTRILGLNRIYGYKYWPTFISIYLKKSKKHYRKKIKRWFKTKA
jgi:glycosyltransferase involved in cell wall biosynthesis